MKIAVVGSGIAGLSAAWRLSQHHQVTLYEKFAQLGMDAHSLEIKSHTVDARIDVPLRVFFDGFYPNLTALYTRLGIKFEPINYSASFGYLTDPTYFRYDNYRVGRYSIPFFKGIQSLNRKALRIGWDILRLFRHAPSAMAQGLSSGQSLQDFLTEHRYSNAFAEEFFYPAFSGICTCSYESIKNYPARVIFDYLDSGLLLTSVNRVTHGTQEVVNLLTSQVQTVRLQSPVEGVRVTDNGVEVRAVNETSSFDHVVLATQANHTASMLENATPQELNMLNAFSYEPSKVVVHSDTRLAPPGGPPHWAPVNFVLPEKSVTPMATIWMNAIQAMPGSRPVFQTWNPVIEPDRSKTFGSATFERPVVNQKSLNGLEHLAGLHREPNRRIWFCGSYASQGIPLLESATNSALTVAENLCRSQQ